MILRILNRIFYNPYSDIKKYKNISIEETTSLQKSCRFRFDGKSKGNQVSIGGGSVLSCEFIFETDQGKISIGENTFINGNTKLIARNSIFIGDNVTIAWGCTLYDHNSHSIDFRNRINDNKVQSHNALNGIPLSHNKDWSVVKSAPIIIEDNVWIGLDCIVLNGVTIGEGAIVGAGSVVRNNVEPWTVVAGNPAVVIKRIDK